LDFLYISIIRALKDIELKINQLTPDLIDELDLYLDYLINKKNTTKSRKLTQDWAGGLRGVN